MKKKSLKQLSFAIPGKELENRPLFQIYNITQNTFTVEAKGRTEPRNSEIAQLLIKPSRNKLHNFSNKKIA